LRPLGSFESWCDTVGGILETAGIEGFLDNADTMFEQADSEAVQWESFLLALDDIFPGQSFRVADVVNKLPLKDGVSSEVVKGLRDALPDFLAEAADRSNGFFQRRLGRCFSDRVDKRFGDSQVYIERAAEDKKSKVQRWKIVRPNLGVTNPDGSA
jgi:hypothetical protein